MGTPADKSNELGYPDVFWTANALHGDYSHENIRKTIQTESLQRVVESFAKNLERIGALAALPYYLVRTAGLGQALTDQAIFNLTGGLFPVKADSAPAPENIHEELVRVSKDPNFKLAPINQNADGTVSWSSEADADANNVEAFIKMSKNDWTRIAINSFFASLVIGSYTAFESLATDLWEEAVNLRPATLGENALKAPRRVDDEEVLPEEESAKPTTIKMEWVRKFGYNLSNSLGSVTRDQRKWNFNKLNGIRLAYGDAFQQEGRAIFSGDDYETTQTLESLRHLLAHRGGHVDKRFLARVKSHPAYGTLKEGDRLILKGGDVSTYMKSATKFSVTILKFVDQWLADNPVKKRGDEESPEAAAHQS